LLSVAPLGTLQLMIRPLLVLAALLLALCLTDALGPANAIAGAQACCPCEADGTFGDDDDCCANEACACFPGTVLGMADRRSTAGPSAALPPIAWPLGAEQRARDRATPPPKPPPIA
jgi:hypothetical protein